MKANSACWIVMIDINDGYSDGNMMAFAAVEIFTLYRSYKRFHVADSIYISFLHHPPTKC